MKLIETRHAIGHVLCHVGLIVGRDSGVNLLVCHCPFLHQFERD